MPGATLGLQRRSLTPCVRTPRGSRELSREQVSGVQMLIRGTGGAVAEIQKMIQKMLTG